MNELMPNYVACHYRMDLVVPTGDDLFDAFRAAHQRADWLKLPFKRLPQGSKKGQCWTNVEKAIAKWGGKMQIGWHFRVDPMPGINNCMADIEAIPHAVWLSPKRELIEVSHDCRAGKFFPSKILKPLIAINVGFVDTEEQARTYRTNNLSLAALCHMGNFYIELVEHK